MLVNTTDLSSMANHMCYLKLSFQGISAWGEKGNSLTREIVDAAWTPSVLQFQAKYGHLVDLPESRKQDSEQAKKQPQTDREAKSAKIARPDFSLDVTPDQGMLRNKSPEQLGWFAYRQAYVGELSNLFGLSQSLFIAKHTNTRRYNDATAQRRDSPDGCAIHPGQGTRTPLSGTGCGGRADVRREKTFCSQPA